MVRSRSQGFASGPQIRKLWSVSDIWAWNYSPMPRRKYWLALNRFFPLLWAERLGYHFCAFLCQQLQWVNNDFAGDLSTHTLTRIWVCQMVSGHLWLLPRKQPWLQVKGIDINSWELRTARATNFPRTPGSLARLLNHPEALFSVTWCSTACSVNWAAH